MERRGRGEGARWELGGRSDLAQLASDVDFAAHEHHGRVRLCLGLELLFPVRLYPLEGLTRADVEDNDHAVGLPRRVGEGEREMRGARERERGRER